MLKKIITADLKIKQVDELAEKDINKTPEKIENLKAALKQVNAAEKLEENKEPKQETTDETKS